METVAELGRQLDPFQRLVHSSSIESEQLIIRDDSAAFKSPSTEVVVVVVVPLHSKIF